MKNLLVFAAFFSLLLSSPLVKAQVTVQPTRASFDAAAGSTSSFGFEEFNLGTGQGTGPLPTLTELGFVQFTTTSNYTQEVIDGFNVGQPNNNVYITNAVDKSQVITDITFGQGVLAVGFDLKNTASGSGTSQLVPQAFTIELFSGSTSLGTFPTASLVGGTTFTFEGFTSTVPITELTIKSTGASPNLDVVLDNFEVSAQVPEPNVCSLMAFAIVGVAIFFRSRHARAS